MSKTLLLADDSVVIQKLVGLSFANEDMEIVSTDNGDDAVTKAREVRPDVVLADVVMPGKSGYEVCEAIKQDPALAHIPVLLLTGTFEAFDESRANGAGADGHITKPFEAQALVERVKTVIKNAAKPAPVRPAEPAAAILATGPVTGATAIAADDLFEDEPLLSPQPARASLFGRADSLDVTPSLSEEDLSDSLDVDLFGPPGDVGGPSFGASDTPAIGAPSSNLADSARFGSALVDAPAEDATIAILAETAVSGSARPFAASGGGFAGPNDDLGLDDPIEVPELSATSFDLDAAFDTAPPAPSSPFALARDDANAATSRSLGRAAQVTDLDELLATPPQPAPRAARPLDPQPEAPTRIDLGPTAQSGADLDFGFDVSEQIAVPKVDLLEESFTSLLDVSDSQALGPSSTPPWRAQSAATSASTSTPTSTPATAAASRQAVMAPELERAADFDVSSSDLATAAPATIASPASPPPARVAEPARPGSGGAARPVPFMDDFFADVPPPIPPTAAKPASGAVAEAAVHSMSPILQQQVQETLEKVAWEAFSDLSETIVKQVIERIERIAWEVIPQMAETLVREEIRKLKGEED